MPHRRHPAIEFLENGCARCGASGRAEQPLADSHHPRRLIMRTSGLCLAKALPRNGTARVCARQRRECELLRVPQLVQPTRSHQEPEGHKLDVQSAMIITPRRALPTVSEHSGCWKPSRVFHASAMQCTSRRIALLHRHSIRKGCSKSRHRQPETVVRSESNEI